ncbi:MAG: MAPEG family protein [Pseudomonadota bacterium]
MPFEVLLGPAFALVLLTFVVWCQMYLRRIREMKSKRISPQKVATRQAATALLEDTAASSNFSNLLEAPILFYALIAIAAGTELMTMAMVVMAWTYVGLRYAHSFVHLTYNTVMHRFLLYVASCAILWAMWIMLAIRTFL